MQSRHWAKDLPDLQTQYTNYKNTLQSLAQKVGEIEQEIEEHKLVTISVILSLLSTKGVSELTVALDQTRYGNTGTTSARSQMLQTDQRCARRADSQGRPSGAQDQFRRAEAGPRRAAQTI